MGGGVAGLALGIGLRRHEVPVQVREAGEYPRHRVCGEFLAGVRPETLQFLGVEDLLRDALRLTSTSWYRRDDLIMEQDLPEPALALSRYEMDARFSHRLQDLGGDLLQRSRAHPQDNGDGVVWATGRRRAPKKAGTRWLGLKIHARDLPMEHDLELHFGRGGYVGVARLPRRRANISGLFQLQSSLQGRDTDLILAYLQQTGLKKLSHRLQYEELDQESFQAVTALDYGSQRPPKGQLCVGDCWSMIPPFTGNGMTRALEQAALAIPPLLGYALKHREWPEVRRTIEQQSRQVFGPRLRRAHLLHQLLLNSVGQAGLAFVARRNWLPFDKLYHALH
ncbi:MAG: electron transfer oxidoreductase [Puniceicoccaceae bacterium 5H]|nr:MAG: electron transfer oxidoreductase [Puniceicoccaceae bacterium 5H]